MADNKHIALSAFSETLDQAEVFRIRAKPEFSPLDLNLQFLFEQGWAQVSDRLRFHAVSKAPQSDDPLAKVLGALQPHLLVRRYDREEDVVVSVRATLDGDIEILSNDAEVARRYLNGLFLECPPAFHAISEITFDEQWITGSEIVAMFAGMGLQERQVGIHHTTCRAPWSTLWRRHVPRSTSPTTARAWLCVAAAWKHSSSLPSLAS